MDGLAPEAVTSVEVSYTDAEGKHKTQDVPVTDGAWEASLRNLAIGKTRVHLTAYNGADVIAESDIEVDLPITDLTAAVSFAGNVKTNAAINGKATPGKEVDAFLDNKKVATTMANDAGDYTLSINPPNHAGDYELTVSQQIRGMAMTPVPVTIQYGDGVTITSPVAGAEHDAGDQLVVTGFAQKNSAITVYEQGHPDKPLWTGTASSTNESYRAVISGDALEDREYKLVVAGISKGYNVTTAEVTINPGKSTITPIEGAVEFPGALADKAHVVGTAEPGAAVSVKNGADEIGTGTADDHGEFDIPVVSPGPGQHRLTLTETKGDATKSTEIDADFGAAVTAAVDGSSTIAGPTATITGSGADGAEIVVSEDGKKVAETTVAGGTYSVPVENIQDGEHDYVVTQTARGNTISTADVSVTRDAPYEPVSLTSPADGDEFAPNQPLRFTGRGTPGGHVVLDAGAGLAKYETDVAPNGEWSIDRPMGGGTYTFTIIQTSKGQESKVEGITVVPEGTTVDRPFAITSPTAGSFFNAEVVTFEGTGTPGDTVRLHVTNFSAADVTATVGRDGKWKVTRYLGSGPYTFDITQEHAGEVRDAIRNFNLNQDAAVDLPFVVENPENGSEHRNEMVHMRGTGTAGNTVTVTVTNFASAPVTTTVGTDGRWAADRYFGSGAYTLDIVQTDSQGNVTGKVTGLQVNRETPVDREFTVTSPTTGTTFKPGFVTFEGTGAAGATITVDPGPGLTPVTTQVKPNGTWAVQKWLGNGPYSFTITHLKDDATQTAGPIQLTPEQ